VGLLGGPDSLIDEEHCAVTLVLLLDIHYVMSQDDSKSPGSSQVPSEILAMR
jgi:hypothetical protein